jgi:glycosyltransferase involved in cell wall biosynthesis
MKVVLDITRLLRRSSQATPTGIDRVELAYLRYFLESPTYKGQVAFVARMRGTSWYLDTITVAGLAEALAVRWRSSQARITQRELSKIESFLGFGSGALSSLESRAPVRSEVEALRVPARRLLSPANLLPLINRPRLAGGAVYLNVSHEGLQSTGRLRRRGLQPVYLVHDLIPITHPEFVRPGDDRKHEVRMQAVLASGEAVVCNSQHTLSELKRFASRSNMPMPSSIVSPLGIETEFGDGSADLPDCDPFFLAIGTIEPRKNHLLLLNAWRHLVEKLGPEAPKLVIVGRRGWENENVIDIIERGRSLGAHVLECNRLPDAHLRSLMKKARAVLFPSFVEGYGLPLLEALALRVPVICSSLQTFTEVAGPVPQYLDPIDGLGWARMIQDYAKPDSALRAAQLERLEAARVPRWADHFRVVDELIRDIVPPSAVKAGRLNRAASIFAQTTRL